MNAPHKPPFDEKPSFIISSTGEVIQDGVNVGKLPDNWTRWCISILVQYGHILRARIDFLAKLGSKNATALALTSGLSITFALAAATLFGGSSRQATPPSLTEMVLFSPKTYLVAMAIFALMLVGQGLRKAVWKVPFGKVLPISAILAVLGGAGYSTYENWHFNDPKASGPVFDIGQVKWQSHLSLTGPFDGMTKESDLDGIIQKEIESLNKTGVLDPKIGTAPMTDIRDTWSSPDVVKVEPESEDALGNRIPARKTVEAKLPDTFRVVVSDNNVFVFSIVLSSENRWLPWSGVFHKGASGWEYSNFAVPGVPSLQVKGFGSVSVGNVPNTVAKAFPMLVRQQVK